MSPKIDISFVPAADIPTHLMTELTQTQNNLRIEGPRVILQGLNLEALSEESRAEINLLIASASGDLEATKLLAQTYSMGVNGRPIDLPRARHYYEILLKHGNQDALMNIAVTYDNEGKKAEARTYYEQAAANDYLPAYCTLAIDYFKEANQRYMIWGKEEVAKGRVPSYDNVPSSFFDMKLVNKIPELLQKAFSKDIAEARENLVKLLPTNQQILPDPLKIFGMFLFAMAAKLTEANQFIPALKLYKIIITMNTDDELINASGQNRNEVAKALFKLAKKEEQAKLDMAHCLEHGLGFKQDLPKALEWYTKVTHSQNQTIAQQAMESLARLRSQSEVASVIQQPPTAAATNHEMEGKKHSSKP
ncbi:MAG: hypothetical protein JWM09_1257 [Francisellaceae bacterium]|nr:hypothetical protein [Francisellaceae bacterium]